MALKMRSESTNVAFVSVSTMIELLQRIGTEAFILGLVDYIEADFTRWDDFDKSPRYASHSKEGVVELMPTSDQQQFSFKYVNGHPKNTQIGLQTVTAFGVLSDVASGYPVLLTEMTLLTALRTAATSALMAKYLAPVDAKTMAMIGCGAQSEFQILAFQTVLGIDHIRLYDTDPSASQKCASNLQSKGLNIVICDSAHAAVKGADIITTCTADKRNATVLSSESVAMGVHINAIGGDCPGKTELDAGLLQRADIFVEYEPQTRIEGEIQQLPQDHPVVEMHEVFKGNAVGRTAQQQITLFDGVGFAVEDFSALRFLHEQVLEQGLVEEIELLANPSNPRDLYGLAFDTHQPLRSVEGF